MFCVYYCVFITGLSVDTLARGRVVAVFIGVGPITKLFARGKPANHFSTQIYIFYFAVPKQSN